MKQSHGTWALLPRACCAQVEQLRESFEGAIGYDALGAGPKKLSVAGAHQTRNCVCSSGAMAASGPCPSHPMSGLGGCARSRPTPARGSATLMNGKPARRASRTVGMRSPARKRFVPSGANAAKASQGFCSMRKIGLSLPVRSAPILPSLPGGNVLSLQPRSERSIYPLIIRKLN